MSPVLKSRPARRICWPGLRLPSRTVTASSASSQFSWITIVSAPGGTWAPVKMRAASPGADGAAGRLAGGDALRRPKGARASSPHRPRARHSRPSPTHRQAVVSGALPTAPPARARAPGRARPAPIPAAKSALDALDGLFNGQHQARSIGAGLAAALVRQADVGDAHALIDRLAHVVDGEGGDRDGGQALPSRRRSCPPACRSR